jgi:hypothetical protein
MVTLSFQVPLSEDGLNSMAAKAEQIRNNYDSKRSPSLWAAWQRKKLKKRK